MLKGLLDRLMRRRAEDRAFRDSEEGRRLSSKRLEDSQADEFVEEHLGAINPNRLLRQDEPPPDY